jgi:hypothetical protein
VINTPNHRHFIPMQQIWNRHSVQDMLFWQISEAFRDTAPLIAGHAR